MTLYLRACSIPIYQTRGGSQNQNKMMVVFLKEKQWPRQWLKKTRVARYEKVAGPSYFPLNPGCFSWDYGIPINGWHLYIRPFLTKGTAWHPEKPT